MGNQYFTARLFGDNWQNGLRPDPTYNRLVNKIHESVKQFDSVNPNHQLPNVLVLVNHEFGTDVFDLMSVYTGMFYANDGNKYPIYKQYSEGHIKEEKIRIDLFIWFNIDDKNPYYRFNLDSKHINQLCEIFSVKPSNLKKV